MDEFIHWSKPYLLLSTSCDEYIFMNDWILDEKSLGNIVNLESPQKFTRNDK